MLFSNLFIIFTDTFTYSVILSEPKSHNSTLNALHDSNMGVYHQLSPVVHEMYFEVSILYVTYFGANGLPLLNNRAETRMRLHVARYYKASV